jgi:hypothetical protein
MERGKLEPISFCDRPANLFKIEHFFNQSTPISLVISGHCDNSARSVVTAFLPAQKVVNIIQTHARRGPSLIPLDAARLPHIRGVPPWIKSVQ